MNDATPPHVRTVTSTLLTKDLGGLRASTYDGKLLDEIYYLGGSRLTAGIIDFFQTYNLRKKVERLYKSTTQEDNFSSIDPEAYGLRFTAFMTSLIAYPRPLGVETLTPTLLPLKGGRLVVSLRLAPLTAVLTILPSNSGLRSETKQRPLSGRTCGPCSFPAQSPLHRASCHSA